jgi:hypothetical protein
LPFANFDEQLCDFRITRDRGCDETSDQGSLLRGSQINIAFADDDLLG